MSHVIEEKKNVESAEGNTLDNYYILSNEERENLRSELSKYNELGFDRKNKNYSFAINSTKIPIEKIKKQLFETEEAFFIIKNLPVDEPEKTWEVKETPYSSAILAGITASVGLRNFGYYEEKKGAILHDVFPIEGAENTQSNAGRIEFGFHVDNPFLPRIGRPEVLALVSINNDSQAATHLLTMAQIKKNLCQDTISALREKIYDFRHADSFNLNGYRIFATNSPVIKNIEGFDELRWAVFTVSTNDRATKAIDELKKLANSGCKKIILQPGELLIFNNYRCMHGRGQVNGWRWLKRIYGARDQSPIDTQDQMSAWKILSSPEINQTF